MSSGDLLEPELDKIEAEMKQWKQQDEDVLSYALFHRLLLISSSTDRHSRQVLMQRPLILRIRLILYSI